MLFDGLFSRSGKEGRKEGSMEEAKCLLPILFFSLVIIGWRSLVRGITIGASRRGWGPPEKKFFFLISPSVARGSVVSSGKLREKKKRRRKVEETRKEREREARRIS